MAVELILPRVDMDMTEGKIAQWYVKNGDTVVKGQVIFEIETDKATMEIEAPADGIAQGIDGEIGVSLPVGEIVGWIVQPGESLPRDDKPGSTRANVASVTPAATSGKGPASQAPLATAAAGQSARAEDSRHALLRATPLARNIAREQGKDIRTVVGSGPDGRVVAADLRAPDANLPAQLLSSSESLNLHWFRRAKGTPVVMLHGLGTSLASWRPLSLQLGELPVVGIDLPNHGKSPRLPSPDLAAIAASVLRRLDEEGILSVNLLGHSMGGGTALALAGMLGARLRSLTLIAPMSMGPEINGAFMQGLIRANREQSLRPWLAQLFGDADRLSSSFVATAWRELESAERRAALAAMADQLLPDGTQAENQRALLDTLQVPVKVIWGTLDRIVPYHQSAGLPGHVALHSMVGIGHLPHVEAGATVAALVRQQVAAAAGLA